MYIDEKDFFPITVYFESCQLKINPIGRITGKSHSMIKNTKLITAEMVSNTNTQLKPKKLSEFESNTVCQYY